MNQGKTTKMQAKQFTKHYGFPVWVYVIKTKDKELRTNRLLKT